MKTTLFFLVLLVSISQLSFAQETLEEKVTRLEKVIALLRAEMKDLFEGRMATLGTEVTSTGGWIANNENVSNIHKKVATIDVTSGEWDVYATANGAGNAGSHTADGFQISLSITSVDHGATPSSTTVTSHSASKNITCTVGFKPMQFINYQTPSLCDSAPHRFIFPTSGKIYAYASYHHPGVPVWSDRDSNVLHQIRVDTSYSISVNGTLKAVKVK